MFKEIYNKLQKSEVNSPEIEILKGRFETPKTFKEAFKKGIKYYGRK